MYFPPFDVRTVSVKHTNTSQLIFFSDVRCFLTDLFLLSYWESKGGSWIEVSNSFVLHPFV